MSEKLLTKAEFVAIEGSSPAHPLGLPQIVNEGGRIARDDGDYDTRYQLYVERWQAEDRAKGDE